MSRFSKTILILLIANLCITVPLLLSALGKTSRHTLYVGTFDQDTRALESPLEEMAETVTNICLQYTDAFTLTRGQGEWVDAQGNRFSEPSFVLVFLGTEDAVVQSIADALATALNQQSILVEKSYVRSVYYSPA